MIFCFVQTLKYIVHCWFNIGDFVLFFNSWVSWSGYTLNVFLQGRQLLFGFTPHEPPCEKESTLKERICSHGEQIISFSSRSIFRENANHMIDLSTLKVYLFSACLHVAVNGNHGKILAITKTCLYNFDPFKPHFCIVKLCLQGYILFSYFCSKHRLWVLVRTASSRRF